MTEPALLEVEGLGVSYGDSRAVHDVSFSLAAGRCLGVIGESGAGKSQAFLALMDLLPARARVVGQARLAGQSLLVVEKRSDGSVTRRTVLAVRFVPMTDPSGKPQ